MTYSPTIRRKRLSDALRQLRRNRKLTAEEVARNLGWDPSKISRIETGDWKLPRVADIERLCDVYDVTTAERQALITLARQARERGWWEEFKDVIGPALPGLEAEAVRIRQYQPLLIPGLLQTPDYTRALCRAGMCSDAETERRVEVRRARQRIFDRPFPPLLWAVIDEAALRKMVGGRDVMRDQVHHLLQVTTQQNIVIQVLLDAVGAHASMGGPIVLLDYETDPTIAYVENVDLYLEASDAVAGYTMRYGHVMGSALSVVESREYLHQLLGQLKEGEDHGGVH